MGNGGRVAGVFGNPIYLGGFAGEFFLFSLYMVYRFRKSSSKWLFAGVALINFVALYMSGTRGSLVALCAAGFVIALAQLVHVWKQGKRKLVGTIVGSSIAILVFLISQWATILTYIPASSQLNRFASIATQTTTASTRFIAWQIAITGFKARPIFGWGPENFYYVFNTYFNPKSTLYGNYETWFDHAHNSVFDVLVTQGVVGIILYLLQYGIIWWMCFKTKHKDRADELLTIILGSFFIVHFVHNIFVFDHPGSYALFYLIAGIVAARYLASVHSSTTQVHVKKEYSIGLVAVQACILLVTGYVTIPSLRQNYMDYQAQTSLNFGLDFAEQKFAESVAIDGPHTPDVLVDIGRVAQRLPPDVIRQNPKYFEYAIRSLDTLLEKYEPGNVLAALLEGQLLIQAVELGDQNAGIKADKVFAYVAKTSPGRQQVYYTWARLKLMIGQRDAGLALLQHAIDLEPKVADSHWYMAVFVYDTDSTRALAELQTASQLGFNITSSANRYIAFQIYKRNKMFSQAVELLILSLKDGAARNWDKAIVIEAEDVAKKANRADVQAQIRATFPAVFENKK